MRDKRSETSDQRQAQQQKGIACDVIARHALRNGADARDPVPDLDVPSIRGAFAFAHQSHRSPEVPVPPFIELSQVLAETLPSKPC
jgi:hypothetical protein